MNIEQIKVTAVPHGLGVTTARLIEAMKEGVVGDVLTDEDLTARCGKATDTNGSGYGNLQSAIRYIERNYNLVWRRVRDEACIKCLAPGEVISTVQSELLRIGRRSRRAVVTGSTVPIDALGAVQKAELLTTIAQHGTIALMSKKNTAKELQARGVTHAMDQSRLLAAFKET